ncbi:MAG: TonB-dependent receptor [Bacteroidaceae bacterium]|nr:TonB-dependent receptor [Bacteroidaceae bacterium]
MKTHTMAVMTLIVIAVIIFPLTAAAQWFNVRGTVYENATLKTLPGASVVLTDSTGRMVAGKSTTTNGQFLLTAVPAGNYTLKVSFMGFKAQSFQLNLNGKGGNRKVADILLREDATMMQETTVEGQVPEMTVSEDTVIYNAAAFTLPPGAMVLELIKRLPGIVIDEDGKITHNGKEVKQILVDGKEFFGRDQQMVLNNLPAEIIERVRAYDKQSDLARITGIDDGEEQTVLDLEVKKDRRRGWFGNVSAGYGTEDRYQGRLNLNRFSDKQKASLVGNANNTQGSGTRETQDVAASLNLEWDKFELNGGVTGRFAQQNSNSWSNSQNFENPVAAYSNRWSHNGSHSNDFATRWRMEWEPDTMTNIILRPEFSINGNRSNSNSESATWNDNPYDIMGITDPLRQLNSLKSSIGVNHNLGRNRSATDQISGSLSAQINRRLQKKGRNITLNLNGGMNRNESESSSYSQIDYYQIMAYTGEDSVYHKEQFDDALTVGRNASARLSYTEPIATGLFLQTSYQMGYRFQDRDRTVSSIFDPFVGIPNAIPQPDTAQCNYVTNTNLNHDIRLQLRYVSAIWRINVGVNLQPQHNEVDYTKGWRHHEVSRDVLNWSPTLNMRWRRSKQESVTVNYGGQSSQPSITDLIPDTLSNANPLNIRLGNPGLKPSFTHTLRAEWRKSIPDLQRSFNTNINIRATQNAVTNRTAYDNTTGGRVTRPENINGNWNANANFNFNTAIPANTHFRVNTNTSLNHTHAVSYVYQKSNTAGTSGGAAEGVTVRNSVNSTAVSEQLRFTYRNEWLELNAHGNIRYNRSRASATSASDLDTYAFGYGLSTVVNMPWDMNVSTDINESSRRGYNDAAMNTNQWIWNAQIAQTMLNNRATLSLRWQDILSQRDMVNRNISATSRTDSDSDRITSYIMLSFTYRLNFFGGRQGRERGDRDEQGERREWRQRGDGGDGFRGERGGFGGAGGM